MNKMADSAGELFYVNVKDAVTVRKTMLETAKGTINCLQRISKFQLIRDRKEERLRKINELVHQLEEMSIKFKGYMPDVKKIHLNAVGLGKKLGGGPKENMKEELIKEVKSKAKYGGKKAKKEKAEKEEKEDKSEFENETDLTKLENAINSIEIKLNHMLKH